MLVSVEQEQQTDQITRILPNENESVGLDARPEIALRKCHQRKGADMYTAFACDRIDSNMKFDRH